MNIIMLQDTCTALPYLEQLAPLLHNEWSEFKPWSDKYIILERLINRIEDKSLANVWVMLTDDNKVIATASIISHEITHLQDFNWWIGEIYTHPQYRGQGIASQLITTLCQQFWQKTDEPIYLYTPDQQKFYEKMHWKIIREEHYQDEDISIMRKDKPIES